MNTKILKRFVFIPAALLGVAAVVIAVKTKQPPDREPLGETATKVRVIEARATSVVPRALGYGTVQPAKTWEAVAEVGGKIVHIHPQLKKGAILEKGTLLLEIDPVDYELAIRRIDAGLRAADAKLRELKMRAKNIEALVAIEERARTLTEKDLTRQRTLLKKGNTSQASVDKEERNFLSRTQSIQSLKNELNLIPAQRDELRAQRADYAAQAARAKRDLERTTITAPFDLRISEVMIEGAQFASQGKVLATGDGIDVAEVSAQVPISKIAALIEPGKSVSFHETRFMDVVKDVMDFEAVVRLKGGDLRAEWPARFARVSDTVDPQTRAIGIIVAVDDPYRQAVPGIHPPLTKNMYVEVELRAKPREARIVVPRNAVHEDRVYTVGTDNRLKSNKIEIELRQTNFAVVSRGVSPGEKVVISDLVPAVEGMLLDPIDDARKSSELAAEARGEGEVR
ncbi:MAG: efflux RND transporter periplasmic adaptor subunit [Rhodospirillales bacterium]|jgi:membrane fusion protein, multidrug efflux system|nr:efflux RND transporter periplasmic adaptor subunit [Rhodospirillales bacterium]